MASRMSSASLAGPTVAMIFVCLIPLLIARRSVVRPSSEKRATTRKLPWARSGLEDGGRVLVGGGKLKLAKVRGPFDLIFQDGDKLQYSPLLDRLVALVRPGGLLVTDNVLWDGEVVPDFVANPQNNRDDTRAIAEYNERVAVHPQLRTSIVPLRDGVSISVRV